MNQGGTAEYFLEYPSLIIAQAVIRDFLFLQVSLENILNNNEVDT